jgi:hypothetical protein
VLAASPGQADVVVVDNRSRQSVEFTVWRGNVETSPTRIVVAGYQLIPVPTRGPVELAFRQGEQSVRYRLDANAAYFFAGEGDQLGLHKIGLGGSDATLAGRDMGAPADLERIGILPVKILSDDDQRYTRRVWEPQLRQRVQAASEVLQRFCRIRLEVVAVETWDTEDQITDFQQSLLEFAREVDPRPAQVAIGWTSQYQIVRGRTRLGGTYGPFQSHILIREWAQHISKAERLELLVHELGHHLGAAHSPESDSVMRPILADRQIRRSRFPLRFDAVNTLAMYLVAEEFRLRNARRLSEISPATKARLRQIYAELSRADPEDPAARKYLELLDAGTP